MLDLLKNLPISLLVLVNVIAVYKIKSFKILPYYKYLLCYFLITIIVEFTGRFFKIYKISSVLVYNVYTFFEFNLIGLVYYFIIRRVSSKKYIIFLMSIFNLIYFLSFIFLEIEKYTVLLGAIVVSFIMFLHLKELLYSDKIINFKKNLSFWITVAFLLYYLTTIPFYTAFYVIGLRDRKLFYVQKIVLTITYFSLIYGLLCSKKQMSS